jgi:hypothetical protein
MPKKPTIRGVPWPRSQLRAVEILLRKCIPDLAAAEIKSEQTRRYVVEVPPVLDRDEWQRKYEQAPKVLMRIAPLPGAHHASGNSR